MAKTAIINLRLLAATALMVSKEEARPYLRGVLIEVTHKGVYYVATDGTAMLVSFRGADDAQCTDWNEPVQMIIPTDECKRAKLKRTGSEDGTLTLHDDGSVTIQHDITWTFKPIDGQYPDWRRIVPREVDKDEMIGQAHFNYDYAMRFQSFGEKMELGRATINQRDGSSPMPVTFGGVHDSAGLSFGIFMPLRGSTPVWKAPDWIDTGPAPEAEAEETF